MGAGSSALVTGLTAVVTPTLPAGGGAITWACGGTLKTTSGGKFVPKAC
jgi:hypothetical protein